MDLDFQHNRPTDTATNLIGLATAQKHEVPSLIQLALRWVKLFLFDLMPNWNAWTQIGPQPNEGCLKGNPLSGDLYVCKRWKLYSKSFKAILIVAIK